MDNNSVFEQITNISKASAYDILVQQVKELTLEKNRLIAAYKEQISVREKAEAENKILKEQNKELLEALNHAKRLIIFQSLEDTGLYSIYIKPIIDKYTEK